MSQPSKAIVNIHEFAVHPLPAPHGPTGDAAEMYAARIGLIGSAIGCVRLGVNLVALAPGKRAFPFHNHHANDELFLILAGEGHVRLGSGRYSVLPGDLIASPGGDRKAAHQLINSGSVELRYLAIGTNHLPDVIEYPDSGLMKVITEGMNMLVREDKATDYWHAGLD
jgi:uncharacterized cupin superfamily protein